jgi:hypothetical protein
MYHSICWISRSTLHTSVQNRPIYILIWFMFYNFFGVPVSPQPHQCPFDTFNTVTFPLLSLSLSLFLSSLSLSLSLYSCCGHTYQHSSLSLSHFLTNATPRQSRTLFMVHILLFTVSLLLYHRHHPSVASSLSLYSPSPSLCHFVTLSPSPSLCHFVTLAVALLSFYLSLFLVFLINATFPMSSQSRVNILLSS